MENELPPEKTKSSNKKGKWTLEDIKVGIEYFFKTYGRYPTSHEFDQVEYLPTSRTIQRSHGGLEKIRKTLNLSSTFSYTKGEYRSKKAKAMYSNAIQYEKEFYKFLISKIPEVRVHEHKIIRPGNVCCDFFIYKNSISSFGGIVIDIFYAENLRNLMAIIRIKLKRYSSLPFEVYFVLVGNNAIEQASIDFTVNNKKNSIPTHIKIMREDSFKDKLEEFLGVSNNRE